MANYKCTVCDGDISSKGTSFVCSNCGMEYSLDSVKAMFKSKEISTSLNDKKKIVSNNVDEIDREFILTYLYDIKVLHSIIYNDDDTIAFLNQITSNARNDIDDVEAPIKPERSSYNFYLFETDNISASQDKFNFRMWFFLSLAFGIIMCCAKMGIIGIIAFIVSGISAICILETDSRIHNNKNKISEETKKYNRALENYNERLNEYNQSQIKLENEFNSLKIRVDELKRNIEKEKRSANELLSKAYSINIIPKPFHTIFGAYYLYDYMSTSKQPLSEALIQANLDYIKKELENVIILQSKQIINQAITNSKLEHIIKNTTDIKSTAISVICNDIINIDAKLISIIPSELFEYQKAQNWIITL